MFVSCCSVDFQAHSEQMNRNRNEQTCKYNFVCNKMMNRAWWMMEFAFANSKSQSKANVLFGFWIRFEPTTPVVPLTCRLLVICLGLCERLYIANPVPDCQANDRSFSRFIEIANFAYERKKTVPIKDSKEWSRILTSSFDKIDF